MNSYEFERILERFTDHVERWAVFYALWVGWACVGGLGALIWMLITAPIAIAFLTAAFVALLPSVLLVGNGLLVRRRNKRARRVDDTASGL